MSTTQVGISQTAPTDSDTTTLFSSMTTWPLGNGMALNHISRAAFAFSNSHAATLKAYRSIDKGTTWKQVGGDIVLAATTTDLNRRDFLTDDIYPDFKLDWVNGGTTQTTFIATLTLIRGERASGT
jgi:hypothetical protein